MAQPEINSTDRTWWLVEPRDVFHKFSWEFGLAHEAAKDHGNLTHAGWHAINAAITAWSLVDWVCADVSEKGGWSAVDKVMPGVSCRSDFQRVTRENIYLAACEQIANAAKHRSLSRGYKAGYKVADNVDPEYIDGKLVWTRAMIVSTPHGEFDVAVVLHEAFKWWSKTLGVLGY